MSSYGPESSSIEKFIISATFFIFIMSSYLSPIQSYNPFCDKIHAFNELLSHLPYDLLNDIMVEKLLIVTIDQKSCTQLLICGSECICSSVFGLFYMHVAFLFSRSTSITLFLCVVKKLVPNLFKLTLLLTIQNLDG